MHRLQHVLLENVAAQNDPTAPSGANLLLYNNPSLLQSVLKKRSVSSDLLVHKLCNFLLYVTFQLHISYQQAESQQFMSLTVNVRIFWSPSHCCAYFGPQVIGDALESPQLRHYYMAFYIRSTPFLCILSRLCCNHVNQAKWN